VRAAYIAWYGPVFWPYAYSDIFYYAFWPYGYEPGYWAHLRIPRLRQGLF
jgi:hypothetical protein